MGCSSNRAPLSCWTACSASDLLKYSTVAFSWIGAHLHWTCPFCPTQCGNSSLCRTSRMLPAITNQLLGAAPGSPSSAGCWYLSLFWSPSPSPSRCTYSCYDLSVPGWRSCCSCVASPGSDCGCYATSIYPSLFPRPRIYSCLIL